MKISSLEKGVEISAICLSILLIIPFLYISFFCHPHSDDFMNAYLVEKQGFWYTQTKWYYGWSGRYISAALIGVFNPLKYDFYFGFKLFPFITLVLFCWSVYYLFSYIFRSFLSKRRIILLAVIFSAYFLVFLPGLSDGIYWFCSNLGYFVPLILFSPWVVSLIKIVNHSHKIYDKLFVLIMGALLVGWNELILMFINVSIASALLYYYILHKKINKFLFISFIIIVLVSLSSILAPGNFQRSLTSDSPYKQSLYYTFYSALALGVNHIINYFIKTPLLFLVLIFFFIRKDIYARILKLKVNLWGYLVIVAITFSIYFLTFTPGTFGGIGNYSRTLNVTMFALFLGLSILGFYSLNFLNVNSLKSISPRLRLIAYFGCFVIFFGYVFVTNNNLKVVIADWRSGVLHEFDQATTERLAFLKENEGASKLMIKQIQRFPVSILDVHGQDVEINIRNYQDYYKIDTIQLYNEYVSIDSKLNLPYEKK